MQNHDINQIYKNIIVKLNSVRRKWRWLILSEKLLSWVSFLAFTMTAVLVCFHLPLHIYIRSGILVFSIGFAVYLMIRILILPLTHRLPISRVAAYLEKAYPNIENRILSTVQLKPTLENNRLGYAPKFVEQLILQTENDIGEIETKKVFLTEFTKIKRNSLVAIAGLIILMLTNFLIPSAFKGYAKTFESIPKAPIEGFLASIDEVKPGNIHIKRGESVTITAKVSGHLDAPVSIFYRLTTSADNVITDMDIKNNDDLNQDSANLKHELPHENDAELWQSIQMNRELNETLYSATIENIDRSIHYYVSTKNVASTNYQITVSHEPIVKTFQLELNYPAYTQLPSKKLNANSGDAEVLYGSEIVFTGESNKPLAEAHLIFEESEIVQIQIENETMMKGSFTAKQASKYHIHIQDNNRLSNANPLTYTLNVFSDRVPEVDIVEPGKDLVLDKDMLLNLKVEALDDFGLQNLQLVYRIQKEGFNDITTTIKKLPTNTSPPQKSLFVTYSWDIEPIGLFPGETLSYYIQAEDIDDVSGPNIGKSRTYTLRFPTLDELYDEIVAEQESEQLSIDELYDEQTDATGIVENLLEKIRKFNEFSLSDKKLLQQAVESQMQIEKKANNLIDAMEQTTESMDKNQLFEPETIQKYQELQELMKEALSEEHQELLKKLSEALTKQELTQQENELMQANFNQEQFQQQLERLKSLYEQLILQQKLEAAAKQAQALADQQKNLIDTLVTPTSEKTETSQNSVDSEQQTQKNSDSIASKKIDFNDSAQKEDLIKQESDNLSEKLDSLGNEMSDMSKSQDNPAPQIQKVADEIRRLNQYTKNQQLSDNLQSTSQSLRKSQKQEALNTGRDAEQTMTELAQGLDNALEFMQGSNNEQALAAMRDAVKGGLYFSHLHEKVINKTNDLIITNFEEYVPNEVKQLQQLAADELSAAQGLTQIAETLWDLGKQQIEVDPKIVWRLNASNDALNRSARALEDRQASLALPIQRTALADINQAIFDLLNAISQMNQQMGADGLQSMLEQLQQLAQSQEQLNDMAQRLSQQMREQGRTPSLQQRLERIASQQQLIREATERLSEIADQAAEMLGSLKDVAEEMKDVETRLEKGTLDKDVINQQERILTRMLDSLKSLEKRDVGKKRKAQVAKKSTNPVQDVPPLHPDLLKYVRKLETTPNAIEFENIPFQYREQLRQYFKALSEKTIDK